MSLYSQYLTERTNDEIIETGGGFATFRFITNEHGDKDVYIIDIFVVPEHRRKGLAAALADQVVACAKERGCKRVIGTVVPSTKGSTASINVLIGYGMTLHSAANDLIVFFKDIA